MDQAVFITYSSKDEKVARTICSALENRGLACWISSRDVKPGQNFQEQIVKAIRAAKIMVLVFTENANNSNEIKKELALASQNNLIVIPVRIQDVPPNEAFAYEFATRQWIDAFDDWENSIARLVELIAATVGDHVSADRSKTGTGLTASEGRQQAVPKSSKKSATWILPAAIAAACLAVLVVATFAYLRLVRSGEPQAISQSQPATAGPPVAAVPDRRQADASAAAAPKPTAAPDARQAETSVPAAPKPAAAPDATEAKPSVSAAPHLAAAPGGQGSALVPESIPFMSTHSRNNIRVEYLPARDHKALAISTGPFGFVTGQADDETAKNAALAACQKRADALAQPPQCELYAVGNTVVYARGYPPVPAKPWLTRNPSIETPVSIETIPLVGQSAKSVLEQRYLPGRKPKALAVASSGSYAYNTNQENADEAVRRVIESCGFYAELPCRIIALDDNFVVPIPTTMKAVGFFQPASATAVAAELREDLARRISNVEGWTAVAAGKAGRFGLITAAETEQKAIDGALADCAKRDRACHVIALGPFAVEPK